MRFTQGFEPAASRATFTLALSDHPAFVLLPRLAARLAEEAPGASLPVRGFTVVERFRGALRLRTFTPPSPVSFVLAWHRRNDAHPAQRWLRGVITATARGLGSRSR